MKRIVFSVSVLMLSCVMAMAQRPECGRDKPNDNPEFMQKARAERAEYLVSKLRLGDEERQVFLTIYDEVEGAKQACMAQRHSLLGELRKAVDASDEAAIAEVLAAYNQNHEDMEQIRKDGEEKIAKVLTPVQMAKFVIADEDFRRSKINKLNGRAAGRPEGKPEGRPEGRGPRNGGQGRSSAGPWR